MKDKTLLDQIADEYLPDIHVNGMDCPDTESAKEIINDAHKIEAPRIINRLRPKS